MTRRRGKWVACAVALVSGTAAPHLAASQHDASGTAVTSAFAPDGRLWRVAAGEHSLQVDYSTDLGATFSPPVTIEPPRQRLHVDAEGPAQIAVDDRGAIHVAWNADARDAMQTFAVSSGDDGRTFSAAVSPEIRGSSTTPELRPVLLADGDRTDLFFLRPEATGKPYGILYRAVLSTSAPLAVTPIATSTCECCHLDAVRDTDGSVVVLSRMVFDGNIRDFGIVRLAADGQASPVLRVTDDDWRIDACPEHGGALAIGSDGRYHMSWFTQGRKRQGLFYASSADRGKTWSAPVRIGTEAALAGHADVITSNGHVFLAWQQFDGARTSILAMTSTDNGITWTAPRELASTTAAADYPRLVSNGKAAYVSWSAGRDGYRLLPVEEHQLRDFVAGSGAKLTGGHPDSKFLLVLWSIDCAPCLREFEAFAALRRQGRQLPLVLVATDNLAERDRVTAVLSRFGLQDLENWIFADENAAKLRFEIDPAWHGEMPRSYFYGRDGQSKAVSGGLSGPQIEAWLAAGDSGVSAAGAAVPSQ